MHLRTLLRRLPTRSFTSSADLDQVRTNIHRKYEVATSLQDLAAEGDIHLNTTSNPSLGGLSKLICTIGPASHSKERIQELVDEGMRILRINCSHATRQEMEERVRWLRNCSGLHGCADHSLSSDSGKPSNLRAIMFDTKGPEIRTVEFVDGPMSLQRGDTVTVRSAGYDGGPEGADIFVTYDGVADVVEIGQSILLDDGLIELVVTSKQGDALEAEVQNDGELGDRRGCV